MRAHKSGITQAEFISNSTFSIFAKLAVSVRMESLLPAEQRIESRLSFLCFNIISDHAIYLSGCLRLYTPSRQLRSSADTRVFRIPSFWTKSSGQRSFSY